MARVGETDACLKRDAAKFAKIDLHGTKQKSFEKFEFSKLFIFICGNARSKALSCFFLEDKEKE